MGYPTDKAEIERIYKDTQTQRRLEREIRGIKREIIALEGAGENIGSESVRLKGKESQLTRFLQDTGETRQRQRVLVPGFDDGALKKKAAEAYNEEIKNRNILSEISQNDLKNNRKYDIINTGGEKVNESIFGAMSGALNPDSREALIHADQYYDSVRKMTTDVDIISKNTGYTNDYISKVKEHLFMQKHDLGEYGIKRFDPDYEIAQSWQRLIDGKNIQPHDHILLKHEFMEYELMLEGYSQQNAHDIVNEYYNYKKALSER